MESYLRVNLLGPGPRLKKKRIYLATVSQMLRNTALDHDIFVVFNFLCPETTTHMIHEIRQG